MTRLINYAPESASAQIAAREAASSSRTTARSASALEPKRMCNARHPVYGACCRREHDDPKHHSGGDADGNKVDVWEASE